MHHNATARVRHECFLVLLVVLCVLPGSVRAEPDCGSGVTLAPIGEPESPQRSDAHLAPFSATYEVESKGLVVGSVILGLRRTREGDFELQRVTARRGVARLFDRNDLVERSRFRVTKGQLCPLEYRSTRKGGDDEENAWLAFDWTAGRVRSLGAGPPWDIAISPGVVDPLLMTLALSADLAAARAPLVYPVPHQGRIKTYTFERIAEEGPSLDAGDASVVRVRRTDDPRDQTTIWASIERGFVASRILKERSGSFDTQLELSGFEFVPDGGSAP